MAGKLVAAGISVIPVKRDGSKIPALDTWSPYMERFATAEEIGQWFGRIPLGLGIVAGSISGNLEVLDFDDLELAAPWNELVEEECPGLTKRLVLIVTPRPGLSFWYRCEEPVAGNQKLARGLRPDDDGTIRLKALIETRGEGGYAVAPHSPVEVHKNRTPYRIAGGDPTEPPLITAAERDILLRCARTLNEAVEPEQERTVRAAYPERPAGELRPGDDYNARESFEAFLFARGWMVAKRRGDVAYMRRPGKDDGWSATLGKAAPGVLHVFTTSAAPLEDGCNYDLFRAYAAYEHRGNLKAAARSLGAAGYGTPRETLNSRRNGTAPRESAAVEKTGEDASEAPAERLFTDIGNAYRLQDEHGKELLYCDVWNGWLAWSGTHWLRDRTRDVESRAHKTIVRLFHSSLHAGDEKAQKAQAKFAITSQSDKAITAMVRRARALHQFKAIPEQFDRHPWLFNTMSGTIDLETGRLLPHSRGDYLTQICPVEYDEHATAPRWEKFVLEVMAGKKHLAAFLQRAVGYSITGSDRDRVMFLLYGGGNNGKSTFLDLIRKMLGDYGHKLRREALMLHRMKPGQASPEIAGLRGKRFAYLSETEEGGRIDEALVKELTGREYITTRNLYEKEFGYTPEFHLWMGTNHKPVIQGTDDAIWTRLPLIPFPVKFVDLPESKLDPKNPLIRPMNRDLADILAGEMPGILRWCVDGCLDWQDDGLQIPAEVLAATQEYRRESDFIQAFLDECTFTAFGLKARLRDVHDRYARWAAANQAPALSQRKLTPLIEGKGFTHEVSTGNADWWVGFGLQDETRESEQPAMPGELGKLGNS
jgi:P4 family phage/plasmid primase-like protien